MEDRQGSSRDALQIHASAAGGRRSPEAEAIEQLIGSIRKGRTVVFCGAGISLHSGIPLVGQLVPYVLDKLAVERQSVLDDRGGLKIPFEALVQVLVSGSQADRFLDIFGTEDASEDVLCPNLNHILLSGLVKVGHLKTIVTTNFDRLIEKALETHGLCRGRDYLVFQDEEGFSRIDWSDPRPRLIKIHGSVEDRRTMAATFEMVESLGLSRASLEVIHYLFSKGEHDDVLVFGYSSSDKFDLTPQIRLCSYDPKNAFYVEHSSESGVDSIDKKGFGDPFMLFRKGLRIFYNTDDLMKILWRTFFPKQEYKHVHYESRWREYVDEWHAAVAEPFSHLMAGNLLKMAAEFSDAVKDYETVLVHAQKVRDLKLQSDALGLLGEARQGLGQFTLAGTLYEESLAIAEGLKDEIRIDRAKGLLRNAPSAAGIERVLLDLEEAQKAARKRQDPREEGSLLINLGNARMARQEYEKALSCFQQALYLLWGDTHAACVIHNNIGMAYVKLGQYKSGEFLYMVSIDMCKQLGDRQGEGMTKFLLGESYAAQKDYEAAMRSYDESLSIAEAIGDDQMRAHASVGIANCHHAIGQAADFAEAARAVIRAVEQQALPSNPEIRRLNEEAKLSFVLGRYKVGAQQLEEALSKAMDLMDHCGQIETLNNMGVAAVGMNEVSSGIQYHERALDLSRQAGDRNLEVNTLDCLSRLYSHMGQPLNATRYYEESIQRARNSGDREKEIDYLNLLAKAYYNLREFQRAINPLEHALQLSKETGNLRLQGVVLNNLGNILASLEQLDAAANCFRQALGIFQSLHLNDSAAATQSALDQTLRNK